MNFNEKAENQISSYCVGLREILMNLVSIGDNDCTHRQWNEKEAILERLRSAIKTLENSPSRALAPIGMTIEEDDGFAEFVDAVSRLAEPPKVRLVPISNG